MVAITTTPKKPQASFLSLARELRQPTLLQAIHGSLEKFWKLDRPARKSLLGLHPFAAHLSIHDQYRHFLDLTDAGRITSSNLKRVLANTESAVDLEWAEKAIMSAVEE